MFEIELKRDEKENLYTQIYETIRAEILADKYTPDTKMPSIRKLASRINVNAETVVKAYDLLAAENLIYQKEGSGSYIAPAAAIKSDDQDYRLRVLSSKNFSVPKNKVDFSGTENYAEILEEYSWDLIFDRFYSSLKGESFKNFKDNNYLKFLNQKYNDLSKKKLYYDSEQKLKDIIENVIGENKEVLITEGNNLTLFKSIFPVVDNYDKQENNNYSAANNINLHLNEADYESLMNFLENNTIDYLVISDESLLKGILDWNISKLKSLLELSQMLKFKIIIFQYYELYNSNHKIKELLESKFAKQIILIQSLTAKVFPGLELGLVYLNKEDFEKDALAKIVSKYSLTNYIYHKKTSAAENLLNNLLAYYLDNGYLEKRIKFLKQRLGDKKTILKEAVKDHFRGVEIIDTNSLFYFKLALNQNINQHDFNIFAEKNSVLLPDYKKFSARKVSNELIISAAALNQFSIKQGVMALAKIYWHFIS